MNRFGRCELTVLVLAAGSLLYTSLSNDASGQQETTGCPECTEGPIDIVQLYGGIECAHGPEHDVDCRAMFYFGFSDAYCWETNGGVPVGIWTPGGDGECHCYDCDAGANSGFPNSPGGSGCEVYGVLYGAMCLDTSTGNCERQVNQGPHVMMRRYQAALPPGETCDRDPSDDDDADQFVWCGGGPGPNEPDTDVFNCLSTNCQPTSILAGTYYSAGWYTCPTP